MDARPTVSSSTQRRDIGALLSSFARAHVDGLAMAGLVVAGFALTLFRIGAESVWYDEAVSIRYATVDPATAAELIVGRDTNGVLYYGLLRAWVVLVGDGEGAVRALSAAVAVATLPVTYLLGARLGGRFVGFGGAVLLSGSAMFVSYAQEARMYALVMFLATVSVALLLVAVERPARRWMVAFGLVAGLGMYAHLFMAPVILAEFAWLATRAVRSGDRADRTRLAIAAVVVALVAAPIVPFIFLGDTTSWIPSLSADVLVRTFLGLAGSSPAILLIATAAMIAVVPLWWRLHRHGSRVAAPLGLVVLWAVLPIVLGIVLSVVRPALVTRYYIVALPALCLVVAFVASAIRLRPLGLAALIAVLVLDVATLVPLYSERQKDDWRAVAQAMSHWPAPNDRVIFFLDGSVLPFEYAAERLGLDTDVPQTLEAEYLEAATVGDPRPRPPRIWLVLNYQWTGQTPPELAELIDGLTAARYRPWGRDSDVGGIKIRRMIDTDRGTPPS
jgi:mannosyltransferase